MSKIVVDASALLAFVLKEPGQDKVAALLDEESLVSAVNWSEMLQKIAQRGLDADQFAEWMLALGLQVVPFDEPVARLAAALFQTTREHGLSLGDRACLALALDRGLPVLTADRAWREVGGLDLDLQYIR